MAAGRIIIRNLDSSPTALMSWQCLKSPVSSAESVLTAAKLMQNIRDVSAAQDTFEAIDVSTFNLIQIMVLADGTNNQSPVLQFYGWSDTGPGHHIGTVTTDLGNFTSAADTGFHAATTTHKSIRDNFTASTAYRGVDQYVITEDYEAEFHYGEDDSAGTPTTTSQSFHKSLSPTSSYTHADAKGGTIGTAVAEADFPQTLNVSFSRSQYKFFCMAVSDLSSATTVGAIFKPLSLKAGLTSPFGS